MKRDDVDSVLFLEKNDIHKKNTKKQTKKANKKNTSTFYESDLLN